MKRHIRRKHPHIYEKEELQIPNVTYIDKANNKEEIYILEYIEDESILDEIDYITTDDKNESQNVTSKQANSGDENSPRKDDSDDLNTKTNDDQDAIAILVSNKTPARKWGWVKKYIRSIDKQTKECVICSSVLKVARGSYGNLTRHIKRKHRNVFNKEYAQANSFSNTRQEKKSDDTEDQTEKSNISEFPITQQHEENEVDGSPNQIDSNDSDNETHNEQKVTADLVPKTYSDKWSWVKKYTRNINERCKQCRICSSVLRLAPGSNNNMIYHIRMKHTNIFMKEFAVNWSKKKRQLTKSESIETLIGKKDISSKESDLRNVNEESTKCEDIQENIEFNTNSKIYIQPNSGIPMRYCWVKDYCKKLDDEKWQCSLCQTEIRMRTGLYGNMKRHIRNKHLHIYEKEILHSVSESDAVNSTSED